MRFLTVTLAVWIWALAGGCTKVECKGYCDRVQACYGEVLGAYGVEAPEGRVAEWAAKYARKCSRHCKANRGYGKDAKALKRCLEKASCQEFAACLKRVHPRGW